MKKFMMPAFGFVFALLVGFVSLTSFDPVMAQSAGLIDASDRPVALGTDSYGGSTRGAIQNYLNFVLFFLGIVAVAFLIYAGYLYITGEDGNVEKAKKILIYVAIGFIVILVSYAIVYTLGGSNSGNRTLT